MVSVSRFSPLRGFPLRWELLSAKILSGVTSVVISVCGRGVVYTGIHELAYRFSGSTTSCIPRRSDQTLHHSLRETNLIFHI